VLRPISNLKALTRLRMQSPDLRASADQRFR